MPPIPRDRTFDAALALLRDPYQFIAKRSRRHGSDLFQTRLLLRPAICMTGPEAAALFYDEGKFTRRGATPGRIQKALFGQGGVQGLDGAAHRHRKQMFMSLMTPERIDLLAEQTVDRWRADAWTWAARERVVLYDALRPPLTRAVCAWAGVPLAERAVARRTRELTAMFADAASVGLDYWRARLARKRAERWTADLIAEIRAGRSVPPAESAAHAIAWHRGLDGKLLDPRVGAVELLNVLRPTVAVAVYVVFVAHALHQHPAWRERLRAGDDLDSECFVQEVRRFYPFFPAVAARAARLRVAGLPVPARPARDPGSVRRQPRRPRLGRPRGVPSGAVPRLGRESVYPHPPRGRRPLAEPSLPRRVDHDRADEGGGALPDRGHHLRRARAGSPHGPDGAAGVAPRPLRPQERAGGLVIRPGSRRGRRTI